MVLEIYMGICPRLDFENIMLFNCLGYTFNIYDALSFYAMPLLIYDVLNDITNTLGYPVKIISKVIDISCNQRRNVLLNSYIIDKFAVT